MKASPQQQQELIKVQDLDTRLGQLIHQRDNLAESQRREELVAQLAELNAKAVRTQTELSDLNRELTRAEGEVATVRNRAKRDQELIDSGSITNPKQIADLQHEVESLARRQADLEDAELELMEQAEDLTRRINDLAEQSAEVQTELDAISTTEAEILVDIDGERGAVEAQRKATAELVDLELLALYEKIRATSGIGAAKLVGGRCEGCHMQLAPSDVRAIESAADDEVVRCEECRCILIRGTA